MKYCGNLNSNNLAGYRVSYLEPEIFDLLNSVVTIAWCKFYPVNSRGYTEGNVSLPTTDNIRQDQIYIGITPQHKTTHTILHPELVVCLLPQQYTQSLYHKNLKKTENLVRTIAFLRVPVNTQAASNQIVQGIVRSLFPLAVLMTTLSYKLHTISVSDLKELYMYNQKDCNTLVIGQFQNWINLKMMYSKIIQL